MPLVLAKDILDLFDDHEIIHFQGFGLDRCNRVFIEKEDSDLNYACVRSVFASKFNSNVITVELYNSIELCDYDIKTCHEYFVNHKMQVDKIFDELHIEAEQIKVRTSDRVIFFGYYKSFVDNIEQFRHMTVKKIRRIKGCGNAIELEVEDTPNLKVCDIVKHMHPSNSFIIVDYDGTVLHWGNKDSIDSQCMNRFIDTIFVPDTTKPKRLTISLLKQI